MAQWVYDLEITFPSGRKRRLMSGSVSLSPEEREMTHETITVERTELLVVEKTTSEVLDVDGGHQ